MEQQIILSISLDEFEIILKGWIFEVLKEFKESESSAKTRLPELLTRKQTARFLGVSMVTLWKWSKEGKIQSYQIQGCPRYKRDEILKAIKEVKNLKYKRER